MQQQQRLAYSYIRMSTEKQIKGDSLKRQMDWSADFALRQGLALQDTSVFRDIGVSAWKGLNRSKGKLGLFIDLVKDGTIASNSFLLVESLDRLTRLTPLEALDLFKEILRTGITVVARGELGGEETYTWQSLNGDFNQLISTLTTMLRSNLESERKSQLIRSAFETKRQLSRQGIKTNQATPSWITANKVSKGIYEYELNDKAETVRWIFERSADGVGFDRIARELNDKGIPTLRPSKRGWWHANVSTIVTSRSTIGEYQSLISVGAGKYEPKGEPIPNYYPPVVTNDLWLRAQKIIHRNRKGGRAGTRFSNLLDGMAHCAHCDNRMYMLNNSRSSKQWQYLVCSANHRKLKHEVERDGAKVLEPICITGTGRFRYDLTERLILDHVNDFGISDQLRIQKSTAELQAMNEEIANLTMSVENLARREKKLIALWEEVEDEGVEGILPQIQERSREKKEAAKRLSELQHDREVLLAKQQMLDPASAIQVMREQWEQAEDDHDRYALRVRTNTAMRDSIDLVSFDSVERTFTVIVYDGLRAYKFPNVKNIRGASPNVEKIKPIVADMSRLLHEVPLGTYLDTKGPNASADMLEKFTKVEKVQKVAPKQDGRTANDIMGHARNKLHSRVIDDKKVSNSSEKTGT